MSQNPKSHEQTVCFSVKTELAEAVIPVLLQNLLTLDKKQQDYGSANLTKFGVDGVVVRMNDKLERIINLLKKNKTLLNGATTEALNEPIADSFLDLANYALIAYVMHTERWPIPSANERKYEGAVFVDDHGGIEHLDTKQHSQSL